jgi:anti-sigma-K factor RskA
MTEREEEQAALNALYALDPHERQILRAEMRTDPRLRDLAAEFEDAAARIALLLPGETPPEDVRPMLLKTLKQRRRAKARPIEALFRFLLGPWLAWPAVACLAAIAWSGRGTIRHLSEQVTVLSQGESKAREEAESAKATVAGLEKNLADARGGADRLAGEIAALKQAGALARVEVVILRAISRRFEESAAVIVWDGGKHEGRVRVERLPPVPANKDYQLWVIDRKSSVSVSAGVLKLDSRGGAWGSFKLGEPVAGAVKFAISIETLGGVARKPADSLVVFSGP